MAGSERTLTVRVQGDTSGLGRTFNKASKESQNFGGHMQTHIVGGLHAVARAATYAGGIIGVSYVAALGDGIRLAAGNQVAITKLQKSVQNSGLSWKALGGHLQQTQDRMSTLSGFTNTELETSLAQLITTTGKAASAQKIQGEAMDLARAKSIPLSNASTILSKVWNGNVTSLTRLGILLPKSTKHYDAYMASVKHSTPAGKAAAKALDLVANRVSGLAALQKKFGGSWTAYSHTASGALGRIKAAAEILLERMGAVLLPYLQRFAGWFTQHLPEIEKVGGKVFHDLGQVIIGVVDVVKNAIAFYGRWSVQIQALAVFVGTLVVGLEGYILVTKVITVATKAWAVAQAILNAVMSGNPIGIVIIAAAALAAAFVVLWQRSATFRTVVRAVMHDVQAVFGAVVGFILAHWKTLIAFIPGIGPILYAVVNHFGLVKKIAGAVISFIVDRWGNVKHAFSLFVGWVNHYVIGPIKSIIRWAQKAASLVASIAGFFGGSGSASTAASNRRLQAQQGNAGANMRTASGMLSSYGWPQSQMNPLVSLWNQESGWNQNAYNAKSGATGIPQALPYTKMPQAAWLPSQGGKADAATQIRWGLGYIAGPRYGSPAAAWAHEQRFNWYDRGGVVPGRGAQMAVVHGGETILPTHKRGGFGTTIVVNLGGVLMGTEVQIQHVVRKAVVAALRQNGPNAFVPTVGARIS